MKNPKIIAFMNAYSQGKSGGDMVFIEIAKRIEEYEKEIITSFLGKKLCLKEGLKGKFLITSKEKEFSNVVLTYFKRTIRACFLNIKPKKDDIFLGTSDFLPDVLPIFLLKSKFPQNQWIQHIFHLIPSSRKIPYLAQKVSFWLIKKKADKIVVDNNLLKNDLIKLGFIPDKVYVNYPGVNLEYLKKITAKEKIYEGVFMAQLRPQKGIFDLLKIWRLVCQKLPNAKLVIIGKGKKEIEEKLQKEIRLNKLENNIDFRGYLPNKEAFEVIKSSKIFLFPSHEEGFGIVGLEAQALRLPVVAWRLPVFEEIFPQGMTKIKIGEMKKFANEVVKLLKNKNFYQRLSKEAVRNADRYSWDKTAERELKILLYKGT